MPTSADARSLDSARTIPHWSLRLLLLGVTRDGGLLSFFGSQINPVVTGWTTAHGDLNRTNLTQPNLVLLDWESWGVRLAGYDAATLYTLALRVPDPMWRVRDTFADVLDSPDGVRAQLMVSARYLRRVDNGEFMDYADHLHRHAAKLLDR